MGNKYCKDGEDLYDRLMTDLRAMQLIVHPSNNFNIADKTSKTKQTKKSHERIDEILILLQTAA